ncbi:hypothetical protein E2C01_034772 [Portunus trituberculatus]|uniref:Uncharacterized protein n=1 Tax=Portunus trituberculatus TaxID=210409 RepID=A0A5B7F782_PORTR|nr:hypothetical protein [Portunus trituberculatus]
MCPSIERLKINNNNNNNNNKNNKNNNNNNNNNNNSRLTNDPDHINPFSTMTRFHIHSAYYLVILHSFRNSCGD